MAQRGGRRQGTPGKAYSNRTDLNANRAPQTGTQTAAAGGQSLAAPQTWTTPDQVPKLNDPTSRPTEPVTAGLPSGPGPGPEALGFTPRGNDIRTLQAAYLRYPSPHLRRAIEYLSAKGRL
jgi:hypothetical protein